MNTPQPHSFFRQGQQIGPYALVSFLGRGGFGEVWLAERESAIVKNRLALKLATGLHVDLEAIRQEAEVWIRASNHPNVLPFFEANIYDGQVAIVSEYAPDGALDSWLKRNGDKAPSVEDALEIAIALLGGLDHLHVRGIIHRDIKPANVLMQAGLPRLADFGVSRILDGRRGETQVAGTLAYMAPEVFSNAFSVATDIWAMGVLLYKLLTGHLPYGNQGVLPLLLSGAALPPALPPGIPKTVRDAVLRALSWDKSARFPSAADFRAVLRDARREMYRTFPGDAEGAVYSRIGCTTIAVTGSSKIDPRNAVRCLQSLSLPYLSPYTTWYCGTFGATDHAVAEYLLSQGQRVTGIGYHRTDISPQMRTIFDRYGAPFVDAQGEDVSFLEGGPSKRDMFFMSKADFLVVLWDGQSQGTYQLLSWLHRFKKDHIVGFV